MPELPDLTVYLEGLDRHVVGHPLERVRLASPFLLRSVEPPLDAVHGRRVTGRRRLGKRLVLALDGDLFLVLHLMIAGRLRLRGSDAPIPKKVGLAAFDLDHATLVLTEAGSKKRASLHVVRGEAGLDAHEPGGVEPLAVDRATFLAALCRERHTLKRALTDPRLVSGIGNAYSDEILHRARLSPFTLTDRLTDDACARLHSATVAVLTEFTDRLRAEVGDGFPDTVTAFRDDMAVHGRYGRPCPECGVPVQRIRYADTESNYCARCQTGGRMLADRSLSRLLKSDWPRTVDELESASSR